MQNPSASSSSSRAEAFPAGLRVLVVDDDPTWLKILEKMLRKCSYEVTTCGLARVALDMLRERRDRFDIVISDVNMPDMDGFKLLEHVGLEMDLPVIMMSVDGETSRVMKGVQHGACDYLLKPVRMKELRNIWQHVLRKKMHEMKEVESHQGSNGEFQLVRNRFEEYEERQLAYGGGEQSSAKRRKDADNKEHSEIDVIDTVSVKKARVVWTVDLHQKFVNAVDQIGFDKVGPKKILDLMNVPGLTRENVASHLQKYRLYLSRLQKQNDGITFGEAVPSDLTSKDSMESLCLQSSKVDGFRFPSRRSHLQGIKQEASGDEVKGAIMQREVLRKALTGTRAVPQKARTAAPQLFPPPKGFVPNVLRYKPDDRSSIPNHHGWSGSSIPAIPSKQSSRHGQESFSLATDYGCLQQTREENLRDDHFGITSSATRIIPATTTTTTSRAQNASGSFQTKPTTYTADYNRTINNNGNSNNNSNHNNNNNNVYVNLVPVAVDHGVPLDSKHLNVGGLDGSGPLDMKGRYIDQCLFGSSDSAGQNNQRDCSTPEDLLLPGTGGWYGSPESVVGMGIPNHDNPHQPSELPGGLYDGLQLDCEYVLELMKHPTLGGDLFT